MLAILLKFLLFLCLPALGLWYLFSQPALGLWYLFSQLVVPAASFIPVYFKMLVSPVWFVSGFFVALLGWNKKMGFWVYFLISLLLSPVVGLVVVLIADKKTEQAAAPGNL
jgi:hypothetical protein